MGKNWKEKYWSFMVAENIEEAMPLKQLHFPNSFFKYKTLSDLTVQSLKENYIWVAEISALNDPFECSIQIDNDKCLRLFYASDAFKKSFESITTKKLTTKEIELLTTSKNPHEDYIKICKIKDISYNLTSEEQLKKVQKRWSKIVEEINKNLKICSFSLKNNSLLLWSHYSDKHKGICIEYDFINDNFIRPYIQPIIYRNKVHKIDLFEECTTMQMIGSSLIKSEEWRYEQEWRLTVFKQGSDFPNKILAPKPKAIYLGTRFELNEITLKNELINYAKENSIPIIRMIKDPIEFKLIEEKQP